MASVGSDGPLLAGVGADRLRASLTAQIDRITSDSIGRLREVPGGPRGRGDAAGAAKAEREPDALDALIARASGTAPAGGPAKPPLRQRGAKKAAPGRPRSKR
jgi:hypothetical protein